MRVWCRLMPTGFLLSGAFSGPRRPLVAKDICKPQGPRRISASGSEGLPRRGEIGTMVGGRADEGQR